MVRKWATRLQPRTLILLYHRVASISSDPQKLCVTPEHFEEHLRILKQSFRPLTLSQLSHNLWHKQIQNRCVIITFDDGYADNLYNAKPLLEKYKIPATVFVVAGQVGKDREFYWDDLARILLMTPHLPQSLELDIAGKKWVWDDDTSKNGKKPNEISQISEQWDVTMSGNPTPKHQAYRQLAAILRNENANIREDVLSELAKWAKVERSGRLNQRALTTDELCELGKNGLVEIGAHTMTHPQLSCLLPETQMAEIIQSKQILEDLLGQSVDSFSYPYGGKGDYTPATTAIIKEAGFTCSCSNFPGYIYRKTDPFQLPRFLVRDWNGEEFAHYLAEWWGV